MSILADKIIKRQDCVVGVYDDDAIMMKGIKAARTRNFEIFEAYTPFPVHGLDKALGYKETRLGYVAFIAGITGTFLALLMMVYMMYIDWPMIYGGKPELPLLSFVPITFELTVLLASLGMVTAYFMRNTMLPGFNPKIYHLRATQDRFVVLFKAEGYDKDVIKEFLKESGAVEIKEDEYLTQNVPVPVPINMK